MSKKQKTRDLAGDDLDAAVIIAAAGHSWGDDAPMPSEYWADCGPLIDAYGIVVRPGLPGIDAGNTSWSAVFAHDADARDAFNAFHAASLGYSSCGGFAADTIAHGATACEAICRCLVLCVFGEHVETV